jgi:hypothetical protein
MLDRIVKLMLTGVTNKQMEIKMSGKSLESRVDAAISHLLSVIDRRGLDNVSKETQEAYWALYQLSEGLNGSPENGSMIVFYTP